MYINRSHRSIRLIVAIVIILAIIQVFVSNRLVAMDTTLVKINDRVREIEIENEDLYQEIASRSAFLAISEKATEIGLTKDTHYLYLGYDQKVAVREQK